jgi:outer membrane protein assembly complex protein YaeT
VPTPRRILARLLACALCCGTRGAAALTVDALPSDAEYRIGEVSLSTETLSASEVQDVLLTKERPWYTPWADRPLLDPTVLRADLERVRRFAEARGYYQATVSHTLAVGDENVVDVEIALHEGEPVRVTSLDLEASGEGAALVDQTALRADLPLQTGDVLVESEYQIAEDRIRGAFLEEGYARVETERHATVDLATHGADVRYAARSGPLSVFGPTRIEGSGNVAPYIVERELAYESGELFSLAAVKRSRANILDLDLFRAVRFTLLEPADDPHLAPMKVVVEPRPPREVRIGVGYSTDEGPRGQLEWSHRNWLGDGRRLSLRLKGSMITTEVGVVFVQPHLLGPANRGVVAFRIFRDDEQTYTQAATRLVPRLEHRFSETLVGYLQYRVELDDLTDVDPSAVMELGGVKKRGVLSAPGFGLEWNTAADPLNPVDGHAVFLDVEQGGAIWGGSFDYYRLTTEARKYLPIGWETILALRLKLGFADAIGAAENLPLFERLYAGGQHSVRGYARRRLGPLSANNNPLGGLSLLTGSVELRRPIWGPVGGALFLDFGQVSLQAWDPPVDDLKFAPGFGVLYYSPVGPLLLDIGFPIDPPDGDAPFQLHFSIGQFF